MEDLLESEGVVTRSSGKEFSTLFSCQFYNAIFFDVKIFDTIVNNNDINPKSETNPYQLICCLNPSKTTAYGQTAQNAHRAPWLRRYLTKKKWAWPSSQSESTAQGPMCTPSSSATTSELNNWLTFPRPWTTTFWMMFNWKVVWIHPSQLGDWMFTLTSRLFSADKAERIVTLVNELSENPFA